MQFFILQCRYAVALKKSTDTGVAASAANRNIQRTLPANLIVQVRERYLSSSSSRYSHEGMVSNRILKGPSFHSFTLAQET